LIISARKHHKLHIQKLPADDEQLLYSKHVEDRLLEWIKKEKCIWLVFTKPVYHDARSTDCEICPNHI